MRGVKPSWAGAVVSPRSRESLDATDLPHAGSCQKTGSPWPACGAQAAHDWNGRETAFDVLLMLLVLLVIYLLYAVIHPERF